MGQFDILEMLEGEDRKMTSPEIKRRLGVCNVSHALEKLRQFRLINFEIKPVIQRKGIRPVYFYWRKERWVKE
jgi:predicted metal-dependent phosphoesterase TrpH